MCSAFPTPYCFDLNLLPFPVFLPSSHWRLLTMSPKCKAPVLLRAFALAAPSLWHVFPKVGIHVLLFNHGTRAKCQLLREAFWASLSNTIGLWYSKSISPTKIFCIEIINFECTTRIYICVYLFCLLLCLLLYLLTLKHKFCLL